MVQDCLSPDQCYVGVAYFFPMQFNSSPLPWLTELFVEVVQDLINRECWI